MKTIKHAKLLSALNFCQPKTNITTLYGMLNYRQRHLWWNSQVSKPLKMFNFFILIQISNGYSTPLNFPSQSCFTHRKWTWWPVTYKTEAYFYRMVVSDRININSRFLYIRLTKFNKSINTFDPEGMLLTSDKTPFLSKSTLSVFGACLFGTESFPT